MVEVKTSYETLVARAASAARRAEAAARHASSHRSQASNAAYRARGAWAAAAEMPDRGAMGSDGRSWTFFKVWVMTGKEVAYAVMAAAEAARITADDHDNAPLYAEAAKAAEAVWEPSWFLPENVSEKTSREAGKAEEKAVEAACAAYGTI